jgi:hypothetical protein
LSYVLLGATLAYLTVAMLTPLAYAFANQTILALAGVLLSAYQFHPESQESVLVDPR